MTSAPPASKRPQPTPFSDRPRYRPGVRRTTIHAVGGSMEPGSVKDLFQRCRALLLANLGLKLVSLVIAVIIYVLIHRPPAAPPAAEPPACLP